MRIRAVAVIALGLTGVLVAGALAHKVSPSRAQAGSVAERLLPFVSLSSHASTVWSCPGPLPVGQASSRSAVVLLNSGDATASATMSVVQLAQPSAKEPFVSSAAKGAEEQVTLAPGERHVLQLPDTGRAGLAAVTAVVSGSAIGVSEVITPVVGSRTAAPLESSCEEGTSTRAYVVPGSTLGQSTELLAITDPTATPAVVDVSVLGGSAPASPPGLQGLPIPADGSVTVDLGRYAVQQSTAVAAVTAVSGRITAGAYETVASQGLVGSALVSATGEAAPAWLLGPGLTVAGRILNVEIVDPGPRGSLVTVSSDLPGHPTSQISAEVGAGSVVSVPVPLTGGSSTTPPSKPGALSEGLISVRASTGVPVLVASETDLPATSTARSAPRQVIIGTAPVSAAMQWLLPAVSSTPTLNDQVLIGNPGDRPVQVSIEQPGNLPGSAPTLATVQVPPGECWAVPLSASLANVPSTALEVASSGDVIVEQLFEAYGVIKAGPGIPAGG